VEFFGKLFEAAQKIAIKEGLLVEEDGVILSALTIALVKEIEATQLEQAIDKALDERDFETCRKLVALCK